MKITILHSDVTAQSAADDLDVLAQVEAVSHALKNLGHKIEVMPLSLNMAVAWERLSGHRPDFVFNLVESLHGSGRLLYFASALLDTLGVPYSGNSTHALYITTSKNLSKNQLAATGLPTPLWFSSNDSPAARRDFPPPYIIKPVWEDASVGIDEKSFVFERNQLAEILREKTNRYGECMVERYIPGREFNLSLLAGENGPEVLPPAEIVFKNFPAEKPRIVDYRAKWDEASFEYINTVRSFDFSAKDNFLLEQLRDLARQCWQVFDLRGYARVDFRVDEAGQPWVLEVNANPCISPDSGFVAAAQQAGLSFERVVERIMGDSLKLH